MTSAEIRAKFTAMRQRRDDEQLSTEKDREISNAYLWLSVALPKEWFSHVN